MRPERRENKRRHTVAQSTVDVARTVVTWPGRVFGVIVTLIAWAGAWEIGKVALRHEPTDLKLLAVALLVFGFGTAFALPERFVKTLAIVADAADGVLDAIRGKK